MSQQVVWGGWLCRLAHAHFSDVQQAITHRHACSIAAESNLCGLAGFAASPGACFVALQSLEAGTTTAEVRQQICSLGQIDVASSFTWMYSGLVEAGRAGSGGFEAEKGEAGGAAAARRFTKETY